MKTLQWVKKNAGELLGALLWGACVVIITVALPGAPGPAWAEIQIDKPVPAKVIALVPRDVPPTYFLDKKTGRPAGFAIDVMDKIAGQAGIRVEYRFGDHWADIFDRMKRREADVVPDFGITEGRSKFLLYGPPLETFKNSFFVRSQSADMKGIPDGAAVGVMAGSIPNSVLKERPSLRIVTFRSYQHAIFDLLAGRIDAVAGPVPTILQLARSSGVEDKIREVGPPFSEVKRAIAVRRDYPRLHELLSKATEEFIGGPEYRRLYVKWYGKPVPFWTSGKIITASAALLFLSITALLIWRHLSILRLNQELTKNIAERRQVEKALRESRNFIQRIMETTHNLIYIYDLLESRNVYANRETLAFLGYTPEQIQAMESSLIPSTLHPDDVTRVSRHHARFADAGDGEVLEIEYRMRHANGQWRWLRSRDVLFSRNPEGLARQILGFAEDITHRKSAEEEKKKLESQLFQAQKMEVIGQLAGGIAHDFNNILSGIIGNVAIAKIKMKDNELIMTYMQHIHELSNKAAQLTQSLLTFSRKQVIDPRPLNINTLISGFQEILTRLIGEDIELTFNPSEEDLIVEADKGQIEQALLNLATNARDAMPRGGKLIISTKKAETDSVPGENTHSGRVRKYAAVSVADTGTGMDSQIRKHIFEPFFTTKEVGKGTGLGLAMVYGIVKQHNGMITVDSEEGEGTTFTIHLPLIETSQGNSQEEAPASTPSGDETILVIEDDESVLWTTRNMLEEFGYTVIEAASGDDAARIFRAQGNSIDMVISDVVMPRKNGSEILEELRQMRPDIKALFMSGYSAEIISKKGRIAEGINFISKPLDPHDLLTKIRELLNS